MLSIKVENPTVNELRFKIVLKLEDGTEKIVFANEKKDVTKKISNMVKELNL